MKFQALILSILLAIVAVLSFLYFRTETIANYPSKGTDIIAFGDSLVEGIGAADGNDFVSLLSQKIGQPIVNLGRAGDTTADGVARIDQLDAYNPKVVLLLLGGNDYLKKIPISDTRKNLEILIQDIQARGSVVLLLGVRGGILNDRFAAEFENIRDMYQTAFVSDVLGGLLGNGKYMADAIHPNAAGYRIIAERIYPVLTEVIK